MIIEDLIGIFGGALFYLSWMVQVWETKKKGKPTFTAKFFWLRIVASLVLLIESFRVKSIGLFLVYIGTIGMMGYNLWRLRKKPIL